MPRLSQMPFVNGDAFSNVGAGASGINNFFGNLLKQAQMRQNMKDAAQRLALQQQLAPYTMLRSLTYAKQAPALIAEAYANAKEKQIQTDPNAAVNFAQQVQQAFSQGQPGIGGGTDAQGTPGAGQSDMGQQIAGGLIQKQTGVNPYAQQQDINKAAMIHQNELNQTKSDALEKSGATFLTQLKTLSDIKKTLQDKPYITHPAATLEDWVKPSQERSQLGALMTGLIPETVGQLGTRGGAMLTKLVKQEFKPNLNSWPDTNIGKVNGLIQNVINAYKVDKEDYERVNPGKKYPYELPKELQDLAKETSGASAKSETPSPSQGQGKLYHVKNRTTGMPEVLTEDQARAKGIIQ